jgi:hypothetical protein
MKIRSPKLKDFESICAISIPFIEKYNEIGFLWNRDSLFKLFKLLLNSKQHYFRLMMIEDEIVGWFAAVPSHNSPHSYITGMSQIFYHSKLKGEIAREAIKVFHRDYFNEAEQRVFQIVTTSSILPNFETFSRILEEENWMPVGMGRLVKWTKNHPNFTNGPIRAHETSVAMAAPIRAARRALSANRKEVIQNLPREIQYEMDFAL